MSRRPAGPSDSPRGPVRGPLTEEIFAAAGYSRAASVISSPISTRIV